MEERGEGDCNGAQNPETVEAASFPSKDVSQGKNTTALSDRGSANKDETAATYTTEERGEGDRNGAQNPETVEAASFPSRDVSQGKNTTALSGRGSADKEEKAATYTTEERGEGDRNGAQNPEAVEAASFPSKDVSQGKNTTALSGRGSANKEGDATGAEVSAEYRSEATFPQQLMDVVEKETTNGATTPNGEKVLEWLPNGDSFIIRDKTLLAKEVLPKYFNSKCKFMSFVRKLYRWGFRQVEKNIPGVIIFMHGNFVRGDKKRCLLLRSTVKNSASSSSAKAPMSILGGNGAGAFMNQNLLEGLSRNLMGLPGQMGQLNPMLLAQGGTSTNIQNLFAMNQQQNLQSQAGNTNFQGLLGNGTSVANPFPFLGANFSSSNHGAVSQQQLNITDFLGNNGNALSNTNAFNNGGNLFNKNVLSGSTLPLNMMTNVQPNYGAPSVDASHQMNVAHPIKNNDQGQDSKTLGPNQVQVSTYISSNNLTPASNASQPAGGVATAANASISGDGASQVVALATQIMQNNPSIQPRMALELARKIREEAKGPESCITYSLH